MRRYWTVAAIVAVGVLLMLATLQLERQHRRDHFSNDLMLRANDEAARIQRSLDISIELLESIGGFFDSSEKVERGEFKSFVGDRFSSHPEVLGVQWVPRVDDTQRAAIEEELRANHQVLGINEAGTDGKPVSAKRREEYFPVLYSVPVSPGDLGFDFASKPELSEAMELSERTGVLRASGEVTIRRGADSVKGIIFLRPVYGKQTTRPATSNKSLRLTGFATSALYPEGLFSSALTKYRPTGLDVMLVATDLSGGHSVLHFHPSRSRTAPIQEPSEEEIKRDTYREIGMKVPGSNWALIFRPAPAFYEEHESSQQWVIIALGLLLIGVSAVGRVKNIRYTEQILSLAKTDALTGLANRMLFQDRLQQALARAERERGNLAVLFLDLDRFKHINDSLGHALGDELLKEVSLRLLRVLRKEDTVARMGGDEFIILLPEVSSDQAPAVLAEKLLDVVRQPYRVAGRVFYLSASIGISLYPEDGAEVDALVANADAAMYRAKSKGRNTYEFYSKELTEAATERWQLESELRHALENNAIQVRYQPEVELNSGRIIGAEALACWEHPERGSIPAERFIHIAEESGLIIELGEYVLEQACRQTMVWLDAGHPLRVAVNVSGRQIQRSDFVSVVERVLHETGLPPEYLELEVTESLIIDHAENVVEVLIALSRLGVSLSIDDFGAGYSSLAYLKRLPIDKLKIDRSFIKDLPKDEEDVAITQAVIALANSMGLRTIAEGVETSEQAEFLLRAGCALGQGFLFGRPVAAENFTLERV